MKERRKLPSSEGEELRHKVERLYKKATRRTPAVPDPGKTREIQEITGDLARLRESLSEVKSNLRPGPGEEHPALGLAHKEQRLYMRFKTEDVKLLFCQAGFLDGLGLSKNIAEALVDISLGGISAVVRREVDPYTRVRTRIEMPRFSETLDLSGEVRWCSRLAEGRWIAGLVFTDVPPRKLSVLQGWIHYFKAEEEAERGNGHSQVVPEPPREQARPERRPEERGPKRELDVQSPRRAAEPDPAMLRELRGKLRELRQSEKTLKAELARRDAALRELGCQAEEKERALAAEKLELERKARTETAKQKEEQGRMAQLEAQLEKLRLKAEQTELESASLRGSIEAERRSAQDAASSAAQGTGEIQRLKKDLAAREHLLAKLKAEHSVLAEKVADEQKARSKAEAALKDERAKLQTKLQVLQTKIEIERASAEAQPKPEAPAQETQKLKENLAKLAAERDELKKKLMGSQELLGAVRPLLTLAQEEVRQRDQKIADLEELNKKQKEETDLHKRILEQTKSRLEEAKPAAPAKDLDVKVREIIEQSLIGTVPGVEAAQAAAREGLIRVDDVDIVILPPGLNPLKKNIGVRLIALGHQGFKATVTKHLDPGAVVKLKLVVKKFNDTIEAEAETKHETAVKEGELYNVVFSFTKMSDEARLRLKSDLTYFAAKAAKEATAKIKKTK